MVDFLSIESSSLNTGQKLIQKEIREHGWTAQVPYVGCPNIFITSQSRTIHIFSTTPPTSSYAAGHIANNKYATHCLLESHGIGQLKTILVKESEREDIRLSSFLDEIKKVVVKPIDGGHGKGITVEVDTENALQKALSLAFDNAKNMRAAVVQQQYDHPSILDIRISTINYNYVAATLRVPAQVTGDGEHTIAELIEIENTSGDRGEPYRARMAYININSAKAYLGNSIHDVPAADEKVFVLGVANYGAGGEIIDITDEIPQWMKDMAITASKAIELPVCGVDFMLRTKPTAESTVEELQPVIVELNKCPSLAIHDVPTSGMPRAATKQYVDYLATLL